MAVSAVRSLLKNYSMEKSDTENTNPEEEDVELSRRRQLTVNLHQTLRTRQLVINFDSSPPVLSLRAPLELINFTNVSQPHWPIECEVINDTIEHIEWDPPEHEPFYETTGEEWKPMPVEEALGKMVYCSDSATKCLFFTGSRVGGSREPIQKTSLYDQCEYTLEFESRFESGNLQKAVQVGLYEYELTLRTDLYTTKHTQWFYFRVKNMKENVNYRFTIVNMMKRTSLFSQGMKPLLYSERAAQEKGVGWQRIGFNIAYYRNNNNNTNNNNQSQEESSNDTLALFSLTWTFQFPHESDTCYFAQCYPYTYSHLQCYLRQISSNSAITSYCKVRILCHSLAGNPVYMLTITSAAATQLEATNKKAVVVTARVHPGETNASWVMEGFLDFLLGDSPDAQLLRDHFVFKVVPMLNPDGVVVGNYRCSLSGKDLNRNYKTVLRESLPCVWHTRNMVERILAEMEVVLYCDIHGHNRRNNVFMYGCTGRGEPTNKLQERIFPLMMSKNAENKFCFESCKFRMQKSKESTGRIVMWKLGIRNSYTLETTFAGSTLGDRTGTHFTTRDLKSMGYYFCDTLLDFFDPDQTKVDYCQTELTAWMKREAKERKSKELGTDSSLSLSDPETNSSGSNSSDSDGLPVHLLYQQNASCPEQSAVRTRKKTLRSRKERSRLQPLQGMKNNQPNASNGSFKNTDSSLSRDDVMKESSQGTHTESRRRAYQPKRLPEKTRTPLSPNAHGGISRVTQWRAYKPNEMTTRPEGSNASTCLVNLAPEVRPGKDGRKSVSFLSHKTVSPNMRIPLYSGESVIARQAPRCSTQLLHLSLFTPPPTLLHVKQQSPHHLHISGSYRNLKVAGSSSVLPPRARSSSPTRVQVKPAIGPLSELSRVFCTDRSRGCHRITNTLTSPVLPGLKNKQNQNQN